MTMRTGDDAPAAPASVTVPSPADDSALLFGRWTAIDLTCAVMVVTFVTVRLPWQFHFYAPQVAVMAAIILYGIGLAVVDAKHRDQFAILVLLITGAGLASSLLSAAPITSMIGAADRHTSLLTYVGALAAFEIARRLTRSGTQLVTRAFEVSVYVSIAVAIVQMITTPTLPALALIDGRAGGLSGHPVHLAAFSAGLLALKGWTYHRSPRTSDAIAIGVASYGIGLASSRVALLTAVVTVIIVTARSPRRHWLAPVGLVAGLVAGWGTHAVFGASRGLTDRIGGEGFSDRLQLWSYGLQSARDHLLFGRGPGRFAVVGQPYFSPDWTSRFGPVDWDDAHNLVIEVLATWGLVGLTLFTAFGVLVLVRGSGPMLMVVLALVGCWTLEPATAGTLGVIGIAAGIAVGRPPGAASGREIGGAQLAVLLATGALLGGLVMTGSVRVESAYQRNDLDSFGLAEIWYWRDPAVARQFASLSTERSSADDSREYWLRRSIDNEPDNAQGHARMALFRIVTGELESARRDARAALEREPNMYTALIILHNVGARTGDDELVNEARGRLCEFGDDDFC